MGFDPATAQPFDATSAAQPEDDDAGALYAALHGFQDAATFGLGDRAAAGLSYGAKRLVGAAATYSGEYDKIRRTAAASAAAHPLSAAAGDVAGLVAGGGAISAAAKAAKALPVVGKVAGAVGDALALKKGETIKNVGKSVAVGAGLGAADSAGHGGNVDQVLTSAALGGVAGPVVGAAGTKVVKALAPASEKAMRLLADRLGEDPDTLMSAYTNFRRATGRNPSMAEVVGLKSAGELRQVAADNPLIGERAAQVVEAKTTAPAERTVSAAKAQETPEDINSLVTRRKERMDAAMGPIRDTPVTVDESHVGLLSDRRVRAAVNADPELKDKINSVLEKIAADPAATPTDLTVADIDSIRKSLRGRQSAYANPQSNIHNPHIADKFGDLADSIGNIAGKAEPKYKAALDQFTSDSNYIKGFQHGSAGRSVADAERPELIRALDTAEGKAGYTTGSREAGAERRLSQVSPGVPRSADDNTGQTIAHAAAAATYHSPTGIMYHLSQLVGSTKNIKMSPAAQKRVAAMLFDPAQARAGIAALRRAGAKNADLRRLSLSLSAAGGVTAGNVMTEGE